MRALIILAHPRLESFNHAIAQAARQTLLAAGWEVNYHDLYQERFDPLITPAELARDAVLPPDIRKHCDELVSADALIFVHPNYWGQPPAILRGYQDRILRMGIAYRFAVNEKGEGVPVGMLKARWALVFTTSNTPRDKELQWFGDPLENLWIRSILNFCGVTNARRQNFEPVIVSTPQQRQQWLEQVNEMVKGKISGL